uniref:Uncharacterized protein n=1 Tax=Pseudomonas phage Cygsa01 TaxID=3138529 RepID=A0AAU6W3Q6_9VIRU
MSMPSIIAQARESAKAHLADRAVAIQSFDETLSNGDVVTCTPVPASNAFTTTVGHVRITWQLNGKRASEAVIEKLYRDLASPEELTELKGYKEQKAWMKKFGVEI